MIGKGFVLVDDRETKGVTYPTPKHPEVLWAALTMKHPTYPDFVAAHWYITRERGTVVYMSPRSMSARVWMRAVIHELEREVREELADKGWTDYRLQQVARMWKNLYMKWMVEGRDV